MQVELGRAHLDLFEQRVPDRKENDPYRDAAGVVLGLAPEWFPVAGAHPALALAPSWLGAAAAGEQANRIEEGRLAHELLSPALRHFVRARDLCPLASGPHLLLADHLDRLETADPRGTYLARARFVAPDDAALCSRAAGCKAPATWPRRVGILVTFTGRPASSPVAGPLTSVHGHWSAAECGRVVARHSGQSPHQRRLPAVLEKIPFAPLDRPRAGPVRCSVGMEK